MHKQLSSDAASVLFETCSSVPQDKDIPVGVAVQSQPVELLDAAVGDEQMGPCVQTQRASCPAVVGVQLRECQTLESPGNHLFLRKLIN